MKLRLEQDGRLLGEWRVGRDSVSIQLLDSDTDRVVAVMTLGAPLPVAPTLIPTPAAPPVEVAALNSVTLPVGPGSTRDQALALARKEGLLEAPTQERPSPSDTSRVTEKKPRKLREKTTTPEPLQEPPRFERVKAPEPAPETQPAPLQSSSLLDYDPAHSEQEQTGGDILLDINERDIETNTDRVTDDIVSRIPFGSFEDLDTQVVRSPLLALEEHRNEDPPTQISKADEPRKGEYDEVPVGMETHRRPPDDDLSLSEYVPPKDSAPRRIAADDDFTLPLPEETVQLPDVPAPDADPPEKHPARPAPRASTPQAVEPRRPASASANPSIGSMPNRNLLGRGAEVWFRQGGEWMPRGTMTVRQHVQAFGGMVRCDDQGGLIVLPGSRLNGSATLPSGDTVHIEAGGSSVKLPPGSSVILWNGEQGLYVRSNVLPDPSGTEDNPLYRRAATVQPQKSRAR